MYSFKSKVRYSEIDSEGRLTLYAILNYLQDASTFHSEELNLGIVYLSEKKLAWVLSYWQVDVLRYPKLGEEIEIGTFPYEFKGFLGYRNFVIKDSEGNILVKANSIWTLMDIQKGRPSKPTSEMLSGYTLEPKISMEYLERKIVIPDTEVQTMDKLMIRKHNIDTNQHVNNAQYVLIAMDYLEDLQRVTRLQAEYKKSALLGNVIVPSVRKTNENTMISLNSEQGECYANILFTKG